ncbi:hypothetical protein RvY_07329 [Ramazzottius varieornatus]|uniref:Cadherin domain-containing protein n=1 Tax=Ramazzottius varieornatus TaxID=947166 RepID=A0A1D1V1Q8_RAMVA|nr:hypothetical protein RvY_07329 [Ramazzottius varieornatus]
MSSQEKLAVFVGLIFSLSHSSSGQTVTQGFSASSYSFPISSCTPGTFIGQVSAVAGGTYSTDNPNISVNPSTGQLTVLSTLTGNINFNVFSRSPSGILSSAPVTIIASCTGYTPVTYTQPVYQTPIIYQSPYYATAPVYPTSPYYNTGYSCANGRCGTQNNAYGYNPRYYGIRNSRWSDSDGDSFYFGSDNSYPYYLNNGNYYYNGLSNNYNGYGHGRVCVAGACFRPDRTILNGRRR